MLHRKAPERPVRRKAPERPPTFVMWNEKLVFTLFVYANPASGRTSFLCA
jgi:hypothetical protein